MNRLLVVLAAFILLAGCAVGNTYDYQVASIGLPVVGTSQLGVAVIDRRPYVLSGKKQPNFVGLQRGGFGNPFNVTTKSGEPLAADMQSAIARALEEKGYKVTQISFSSPDDAVLARAIGQNGAKRNVVLILKEWKSDAMMSLGLTYDIVLQIVDEDYGLLAQTSSQADKEKMGGAGLAGQNSRTVIQVFELKVSRLFNDPAIKKALESDSPADTSQLP